MAYVCWNCTKCGLIQVSEKRTTNSQIKCKSCNSTHQMKNVAIKLFQDPHRASKFIREYKYRKFTR